MSTPANSVAPEQASGRLGPHLCKLAPGKNEACTELYLLWKPAKSQPWFWKVTTKSRILVGCIAKWPSSNLQTKIQSQNMKTYCIMWLKQTNPIALWMVYSQWRQHSQPHVLQLSATPPSPCQQESRTKASSAQRPSRLERSICGGAASSPPDACGMSPTNTQHRAVFTLFTEINRNNNHLWILVGFWNIQFYDNAK